MGADTPQGGKGRRVPANPAGRGQRPPATAPGGGGRRVPATPRAPQGNPPAGGARKARKPDSNVKKAANTAVRQGANSALTAATGGVAAPVVAVATSLIGNDAKAKKNRRRLLLAGVIFLLCIAFVMATIMATVFGVSIMGGGTGAAGTSSPNNGNCLTYAAPRVTQPGGGGPGAAAGALGAPLDPEFMENASGFGDRDAPTAGATSWHDGIDFSAAGIYGKPIYAPAAGTVAQAGPASGYGNWIIIDHDLNGEKVSTLYGHIEDGHVLVAAGDRVEAGQHIADVGNAGTSTGPHLHFGVYPGGWKSQAGVDPMPWLSKFKAQAGQDPAPAADNAAPSPVANSTPADPSAVTAADWEALAEKESTNNWSINNGNGFSGGVQFTVSTWTANGGTEYAPEPWQASKQEQMEVANRVLKTQGWDAWPPSATIPGLRDKKPAPEGTFVGGAQPPADSDDDGNAAAPRGPPEDLPKSDKGDENNLQEFAQRGMRLIAQQFPAIEQIGGFRPGSGDHGTGSAVDAMIPGDYRSQGGVALGDDVAKFFIDHAADLNVKYVIWRQQIWQGGSWTKQGDRGSDNDNHYNHVHVSFNQSGAPAATVPGLDGATGPDAPAPSAAPEGAQPYPPEGEQKEQELTPEQQANIKALISAAKRSGIEPQARAAVLALAYAGTQSNFISKEPTDDDPRIGIFAQTPLEGTDSENVSNLINVPYAADSFFERLKEAAAEDDKWSTKPMADVLTAMYPEQRTLADRFPSWEQLAINAVTSLWDDPLAQADSIMVAVAGGIECAQGAVGGRELKPGAVPERFVKWITLGGQVCEGIPAPLLAAQIRAESGFDESATSPDNAMGSSQFMPDTWQTWGKKVDDAGRQTGPAGGGDPRNAADATIAQAHMMCADYETMRKGVESGRLTGDPVALTIAAYNAGSGAVFNAGGMPSGGDYTTQTQPYVEKILGWAKEMDGGAGQLKPSPGGSNGGGAGNSKILEYANKMVGQEYIWGGGNQNGPSGGGIDCSGLTVYAYAQATDQRVILPRTTYDQIKVGRQVTIEEAQPGDLVLSNFGGTSQPEHVDIYEGNGTVIGAIQPGSPLKGGKPMPSDAHIRHVPEVQE